MEKRQVGAVGEKMAESYLRGKGYRILERNYSCRYGEADIIAQDRDYLVFVEVKLRKNAGFAEARDHIRIIPVSPTGGDVDLCHGSRTCL